MNRRIFRAILLPALLVLICCFALFVGVMYGYFSQTLEAQLENSLLLAAQGVEQSGEAYFTALEGDFRLTWVDGDGTVLYDTQASADTMENHSQRQEIQQALSSGMGKSIRNSDTLTQRTIYQALRLTDGTVLRISVSYATALSLAAGMLWPAGAVLLLAAALSLILARKLTKNIIAPLTAMDLEHLPSRPPYPELQPLTEKIRGQQQEIARQEKELADKRLNMEFAEQNRREFTANVSHELKTPLQSIMGRAELIENGLVKPEDLPRFAGNIRRESNRLLLLIQDIIHLSRLDEGGGMESEPVDLFALAQEELAALQPIAGDISIDLLGQSVVIQGVPQLVREILHNLCDNAIKYNRPGGRVVVRVTQGEGKAILSVSDTGIGIPEAHQSRIFERFYRVDKSRSKDTGGTGLGLSIVKHAAAYMNAEISLESAVGFGTTITVQFPL